MISLTRKLNIISIKEFKEKAQAKEDVQGLAVCKQFVLDEVKQVEGEDLTLQFTISTGAVDRDNDTINPEGWKLDNYMKNPVVLFAHDYHSLPVANSLAVWTENGKLKSRAKFTPRDMYPFGYMVYQFYREGFMRATSVGFNPTKWQFNDERKYGIDFQEQELLEYSCVPVPANPEALIEATAKGIDTSPLKEWAERVLDEWHEEKGMWLPKSKVEQMFNMLNDKKIFLVTDAEGKSVGNGTAEKGAISYNSAHPDGTPKAPEDEEWDGPAEVAAAEVEDLKVMCAWVDSENADKKGAYKLPHHKASGQHAVVWRGVSAAMAALLGARGGVNIPEGDRRGVYNHLAKHYREFDKEPPEFADYDLDDPEKIIALVARCYALDEKTTTLAKSGRVLSRANEDRIRRAAELLQEVLLQLEEEPEQDGTSSDTHKIQPPEEPLYFEFADSEPGDEPQTNLDIDADTLKEMVRSAVDEAVRAITGKID